MTFHEIEMRSQERFSYLKTIKYVCIPESESEFKGVTIDVSKTGMSLYIFSPCRINEGIHMKVKDDLPVASTNGVVRWVRQIDQDLYRAGIQFN